MSELSTVAIKDGHRGHLPHHHHPPLDAERADRISRLAGLERVAAARQASLNQGAAGLAGGGGPSPAYFDANSQPQIMRERSTVGSASATGSVGGRTTWASGSDVYEADKMSEDQDAETSSTGGFSDETPSLVGFGEGARTPARQQSSYGSPVVGKASALSPYPRDQAVSPMVGPPMASSQQNMTPGPTDTPRQDARMIDGMTYDPAVVDTTNQTPQPTGAARSPLGAETAERIIQERMDKGEGRVQGDATMADTQEGGKAGLGKFYFEGKQ